MKVWKLEFGELSGECYCEHIEDVKEYVDNMDTDNTIMITCEEMDEDDYSNLPELEGC